MKMESIVLSYNENCPLHFVRAARIPTRYQACHVTYQLKMSSNNLWLAQHSQEWIQKQLMRCKYIGCRNYSNTSINEFLHKSAVDDNARILE